MEQRRVLFTAPYDFLPDLDDYTAGLDVWFQEAWQAEALPADEGFSYWVVNPGQHFVVDGDVLSRYPSLRMVGTPSTGSDHIDRNACGLLGLEVVSLLDDRETLESISASAEFTFLHVLNALRRIDTGYHAVASGHWRDDEAAFRGRELSGRRVGLVGYGRIGRRLAAYFSAFGCPIAAYDPNEHPGHPVTRAESLKELFDGSDVVVVCCALTEETRGLIGRELVRLLPGGAVLANTARGEILDEAGVMSGLWERPDLRLVVDVVTGEVTGTHLASPLVRAHGGGQVLVTPHMAGATTESQWKAARSVLSLVQDHARGNGGREESGGREDRGVR